MIKDAINTILGLAKPQTIEVDGKPFFDNAYLPAKTEFPKDIAINNLTGIVDFITNKPESWPGKLFIHVRDFDEVVLYHAMSGNFNQRTAIIKAKSRECQYRFGRQFEVEDFIISLNGMFLKNDDRDYLLNFVSNVKMDASATVKDDGVSQTITARQGASSLVKDIPIKPLVDLKPFRTFNDIDQPESKFVFRLKVGEKTPTCALYECDGEAWKQEAIANIKIYFNIEVPKVPVIA